MLHCDTHIGKGHVSQNNKRRDSENDDQSAAARNGTPQRIVTRMVVKVSIPHSGGKRVQLHHLNELQNLRLIARTQPNAPHSIPRLVWDPTGDAINGSPEIIQFGITPVGQPISVNVFADAAHFSNRMDKLLDGLNWLHRNARIIHRDLRLANVIYDMALQSPVLIDYDCAWQIPEEEPEAAEIPKTFYIGGII